MGTGSNPRTEQIAFLSHQLKGIKTVFPKNNDLLSSIYVSVDPPWEDKHQGPSCFPTPQSLNFTNKQTVFMPFVQLHVWLTLQCS